MGAIGVWIAMIVDWVFRAVAFCLRYRGKRWLSYSIYKKTRNRQKQNKFDPAVVFTAGSDLSRHKNEAVFRLPHFSFNYLLPVIFAISSA